MTPRENSFWRRRERVGGRAVRWAVVSFVCRQSRLFCNKVHWAHWAARFVEGITFSPFQKRGARKRLQMFLLCSFSHHYLKVSLSQGLTGGDGSHKGSLLQSTFIHRACCSRVPYCSRWQIGNVDDISRQTGKVLWLLTSGVGNSSRSPATVRLKTGHFGVFQIAYFCYQNTSCFQCALTKKGPTVAR